MSRAAFIENIARKGNMSKAEAKRTVDLVLGKIEAGLKKSKKEGRYTIGNFGTFTITRRPARKGRNPRTGEAIRIKTSKGRHALQAQARRVERRLPTQIDPRPGMTNPKAIALDRYRESLTYTPLTYI